MARVTLALLGSLCFFLSPAFASRAPHPGLLDPGRNPPSVDRALVQARPSAAAAAPQEEEYQVTEDTEIMLDGRPCRYRDVPANAVIMKMEVSRDHVALKIHFRTRQ